MAEEISQRPKAVRRVLFRDYRVLVGAVFLALGVLVVLPVGFLMLDTGFWQSNEAQPVQAPLHIAASIGDAEEVGALLEAGADPDIVGERGRTPVHVAARAGSWQALEILLEAGADPVARNEDGDTPLHEVAATGDSNALMFLLPSNNASCADGEHGWIPQHSLAQSRRAKATLLLLEAGASLDAVNARGQSPLQLWGSTANVLHEDSRTALHWAVQAADATSWKSLLDWRADLDTGESNCTTALHVAADRGHPAVALILLEAGADVNKVDGAGRTPLAAALRSSEIGAARVLEEAGGNVSVPAARLPSAGGAEGVYVDDSDEPDATALLGAAWAGDAEAVQALLDAGAGPDVKDLERRTPLHVAAGNGSLDVARVLLAAGADINVEDRARWTPLSAAAVYGHVEMTRTLLEAGADLGDARIDWRDWHGTPLTSDRLEYVVGLLGHADVLDVLTGARGVNAGVAPGAPSLTAIAYIEKRFSACTEQVIASTGLAQAVREISHCKRWIKEFLEKNYKDLINAPSYASFELPWGMHVYMNAALPYPEEYGPQYCLSYNVHFIKMMQAIETLLTKPDSLSIEDRGSVEAILNHLDAMFRTICPSARRWKERI